MTQPFRPVPRPRLATNGGIGSSLAASARARRARAPPHPLLGPPRVGAWSARLRLLDRAAKDGLAHAAACAAPATRARPPRAPRPRACPFVLPHEAAAAARRGGRGGRRGGRARRPTTARRRRAARRRPTPAPRRRRRRGGVALEAGEPVGRRGHPRPLGRGRARAAAPDAARAPPPGRAAGRARGVLQRCRDARAHRRAQVRPALLRAVVRARGRRRAPTPAAPRARGRRRASSSSATARAIRDAAVRRRRRRGRRRRRRRARRPRELRGAAASDQLHRPERARRLLRVPRARAPRLGGRADRAADDATALSTTTTRAARRRDARTGACSRTNGAPPPRSRTSGAARGDGGADALWCAIGDAASAVVAAADAEARERRRAVAGAPSTHVDDGDGDGDAFELLGVDVLPDADGERVWLLEVQREPSLQPSSLLDLRVKAELLERPTPCSARPTRRPPTPTALAVPPPRVARGEVAAVRGARARATVRGAEPMREIGRALSAASISRCEKGPDASGDGRLRLVPK